MQLQPVVFSHNQLVGTWPESWSNLTTVSHWHVNVHHCQYLPPSITFNQQSCKPLYDNICAQFDACWKQQRSARDLMTSSSQLDEVHHDGMSAINLSSVSPLDTLKSNFGLVFLSFKCNHRVDSAFSSCTTAPMSNCHAAMNGQRFPHLP